MAAVGRPNPYKRPCAQLLERAALGELDVCIDTELLQEVLYVYISRGERSRGLKTFDDLLHIFPSPIAVTRGEIVLARQLLERYPVLSPRDSIHAAVALTQGLEGIVTTDKGMAQVREVTCFHPLELYPG